MSDYYYVIASLPSIVFGEKPPISFHSVMWRLKANLKEIDLDRIRRFLLLFDFFNLKRFWEEKPLDNWGFLDRKGIDEALLVESELPDFLFEFLDKYKDRQARVLYFSELLSIFFNKMIAEEKGFLKSYLTLQRNVRLLSCAVLTERKIEEELFFEDIKEPDIDDLLKKKENYSDVDFDYASLVKSLKNTRKNPLELYKEFMFFQFNQIDELMIYHPFSMDQILGYLAKLKIVEEMSKLDPEMGKKVIDQIA